MQSRPLAWPQMAKRVVVSRIQPFPDMFTGLTVSVVEYQRGKWHTVIQQAGSDFPLYLPNRTGLIQTHYEGSRFVISDGYQRRKKEAQNG